MHPKLRHLYNLPETPFWAKCLISQLATYDPVEVVNVLEVVTETFKVVLDAEVLNGTGLKLPAGR